MCVLKDVVTANGYDNKKENIEYLFNAAVIESFGDCRSQESSAHTAADHGNQIDRGKIGNSSPDQGADQTRRLRKNDDVNRVLGRLLGVHREKVVENRYIHRSSANSEKGGDKAQDKTDKNRGKNMIHLQGLHTALENNIEQDTDRHYGQAGRLDGPEYTFISEAFSNQIKKDLSQESSDYRADSERCTRLDLKLNSVVSGSNQRAHGHG